jgi:hypothetical protein
MFRQFSFFRENLKRNKSNNKPIRNDYFLKFVADAEKRKKEQQEVCPILIELSETNENIGKIELGSM